MADDLINIEIDGKPVKARKGEMIIQVADREGIYIPRFCYHEKLSVAANCRMCLVEQEKVPKPLPACATPVVAEGTKIFTRSVRAVAAQRATMEFLLINHPLDCPICDQGGECELQDLAMGYGRDISRYSEKKRVVKDEDIGPLVSTDMTRCIHCTRCVRFGQEIAGIQEMGGTGRGEHLRIGTYIGKAIDHELSGNIIDLCPVGALNSKPFRNRGRGWEMTQVEAVSPHDCLGSNMYGHVLRGRFMRAVPKPNEAVNETWLSDRDRFGYTGIYSEDRLTRPMIRKGGEWQTVDWETALEAAVTGLRSAAGKGGDALGVLASPSSTTEELFLLQKLVRGLGCNNIDVRLRQADFRDDAHEPLFPWLGQPIQDLEALSAVLVVGSNLRKEVPLLAHRLRKAALKGGAVMFLNPRRYDYLFPVTAYAAAESRDLVASLAAVLKATGKPVPAHLKDIVGVQKPDEQQQKIAAELAAGERKAILLGHLALQHPHYADLRAVAAALAEATGAKLGYLPEGANGAGAWLAGAVPHRGPGGHKLGKPGRDARALFEQPREAYLLLGVEPELDCWDGAQALKALKAAKQVVAVTSYVTETMKKYAQVLLPACAFGETSGTYVNAEGRWQSFTGVVKPLGEARPGWKILRVLGNLFELKGFDYLSSEEVRNEAQQAIEQAALDNRFGGTRTVSPVSRGKGLWRVAELPLYSVDVLVRRASPLQETRDADVAYASLSPDDAKRLKLEEGDKVVVRQNGAKVTLPAKLDTGVPAGDVWVPAGLAATAGLGPLQVEVEVEKA